MTETPDNLPKRWKSGDRVARIMTTCEGYAMMRFKGAMPFVFPIRQLLAGERWCGNGPFVSAPLEDKT